jgi:uncharacterized membrane protein YozB (DUF420 family)
VRAVIFLLLHTVKTLYKLACLNVKKDQLNRHFPVMISTLIVIMRLLYMYLTRTSLGVMDCVSVDLNSTIRHKTSSNP